MFADRLSLAPPLGSIFVGAVLNAVIGLTVATTPLITRESGTPFWANVVTGSLVAGMAAYNAWSTARAGVAPVPWASAGNIALGVWLIVFPFLLSVSAPYVWTNVLLGILLVLVAAHNAWSIRQARSPPPRNERVRA